MIYIKQYIYIYIYLVFAHLWHRTPKTLGISCDKIDKSEIDVFCYSYNKPLSITPEFMLMSFWKAPR